MSNPEDIARLMRQAPGSNTAGGERRTREAREWHPPRWVAIASLPDGSTLGKCRVCPKWTHDKRTPDNPASHSSLAAQDPKAIKVWVTAHAQSEIHKWYLTAPTAEPTPEEVILRGIFGKDANPRRDQVPFPHVGSSRTNGAKPKW